MNEDLRSALDGAAGGDPHVDLTDRVWAQGRVVRRRRQTAQAVGGLAAAAVLVGTMWFAGGLMSDPDGLPGPAETPTDDAAVTSLEPDRATDDDATEDEADVTAPEGEADDTATEGAADDDTGAAAGTLPIDPCTTAYADPVLVADGLPEATTTRAAELLELAAGCDLDGLTTLAEQDQTFLSFGVVSPEEAFSGPEGQERAAAVAILLTLFEPGQDATDAPYRWPGTVEGDEDWALVIDSGLHTQEQVDLMRGSGMGYTGWRVGIDAGGQWSFLTAGD